MKMKTQIAEAALAMSHGLGRGCGDSSIRENATRPTALEKSWNLLPELPWGAIKHFLWDGGRH